MSGAERKLATIVFADLVGSTTLVAGRGPEDVRKPSGQTLPDRVEFRWTCYSTIGRSMSLTTWFPWCVAGTPSVRSPGSGGPAEAPEALVLAWEQ